jgi:glycosyltransferase involved in cell wall biosynthesis
MFCSTVIPTVNRPTLSRAVHSVLDQGFHADDFEVIVVNDSGRPLPEMDWLTSAHVQIVHTNKRERSVARNTGAAIARGRYLHFLDDDDWLMPGALETLLELAESHPAAWLYGSSQLVDGRGRPLIQLHHRLNGNCFVQVMAGEWIPLQASLIEARAFFAVSGFNPRLAGPEDIDLLRRIGLRHNIHGVERVVACITRSARSSTTNTDRHPEMSRWARERILDSPEVFGRMQASSRSGYWRGRVVRVYLTSMLWNLRRMRLFTALSRAMLGIMALGTAGSHLLWPAFWQAIARPYASESFARGLQQAKASP